MVLQRGKTNIIWGWTQPGATVSVSVAETTVTGVAGPDGRWQVWFNPPVKPGPHTVRVAGPDTVEFTNVLVGDVWLCSGQSNMEFPLSRARNGVEAVKQAAHFELRFFIVGRQPAYVPAAVPRGTWRVCTPDTVTADGGLSAVAYYFARKVQSETNVPIGLVQAAVGGTPAETWTSAETLRGLGGFEAALAELERLRTRPGPQHGNYIMHWYDEFDVGEKGGWMRPELDESEWKSVTIPGGFAELGVPDTPAVCYFRKAVLLPSPLPPGDATIHLGVVERMDTAYVNGHWVGASAWVENPRRYTVPRNVLRPGTNVITVRVFKTKPDGGFMSRPTELRLVLGDGTEIPLAGQWKGRLSVDARPPHPLPLGFENWPVIPSVLYNGMIAPIAPMALSGVIWYQGESNVGRAAQYRKLLSAMIADWRRAFGQGEFPFYIVSLASFLPRRDTPGDDAWAELREAQAHVARTVPNCGLAVAIDLGDANDIHPIDKKEVGERLALCALAGYYRRDVVSSGPTLVSVERLPGALKLNFTNTAGGLVVRGDKLGEFSVAGPDRKWHWADARIEGESVIVSSRAVAEPVAVRYAWQANPLATLYNGVGLPAVPFRTDE
ncbi:MAG: sialate O-acetylesterase [Verrucomicrobiae bacterium]|nr:sialate O-acetylesterase [Verrucomicrobiae bacterium]